MKRCAGTGAGASTGGGAGGCSWGGGGGAGGDAGRRSVARSCPVLLRHDRLGEYVLAAAAAAVGDAVKLDSAARLVPAHPQGHRDS